MKLKNILYKIKQSIIILKQNLPILGVRLLKKDEDIKTIELLECEIEYIDTFLKEMKLSFENNSSLIEAELKNMKIFNKLYEKEEDKHIAYSKAKARINKYKKQIELGWRYSLFNFSKLNKSIFLPSILIFITAFVGNNIATSLQKKSFERNKSFETRIELLKQDREIASNILVKAKEQYFVLANLETQFLEGIKNKTIVNPNNNNWGQNKSKDIFKDLLSDLERLKAKSKNLQDVYGKDIYLSIDNAIKYLTIFVAQLNKNGYNNITGIGDIDGSNKNFTKSYYDFSKYFETIVVNYSNAIIYSYKNVDVKK